MPSSTFRTSGAIVLLGSARLLASNRLQAGIEAKTVYLWMHFPSSWPALGAKARVSPEWSANALAIATSSSEPAQVFQVTKSYQKLEMKRGVMGGRPPTSRSLSVSSDSDAVEEPAVLEEARKGSSAAGSSLSSRGRGRISWVISKSSQSSSSADSDHDSPRARRVLLSSSSRGLCSTENASGSSHTFSSRRPIRVSFMDECASLTSTGGIQSHGTGEVPLSTQSKEVAIRQNGSQFDLKTSIACRANAIANANRNVAAMAAEKRAIDETQNPELDAIECEVNGLHRQLNDVKESLRRRCLNILNSLVGRKWTIDTSGPPVHHLTGQFRASLPAYVAYEVFHRPALQRPLQRRSL